MPVNTNAFYHLSMIGECGGQDIINNFYYRLAQDLIPGDFNFAGAQDLAELFRDYVWRDTVNPLTFGYASFLPTAYTLKEIVVTPYDADYNPIYQLPYVLGVGEDGLATAARGSNAACAIIRFNLAPQSLLNGFNPPKSGYIAYGPLNEEAVDPDGLLSSAWQGYMGIVGELVSTSLVKLTPPCEFVPVRIKRTKVGGVLTLQGWSDVLGASPRAMTSFRRSRISRG